MITATPVKRIADYTVGDYVKPKGLGSHYEKPFLIVAIRETGHYDLSFNGRVVLTVAASHEVE